MHYNGATVAKTSSTGFDITGALLINNYLKLSGDASSSLINVSSGNLSIKNSTSSSTLAVFNVSGSVKLFHNNVEKFQTTGDGVEVNGTMTASGDVEAYGTYNASDARLKKDVYNVSGGLDLVRKMRPVYFNWININNGQHVGYIAQEMMEVLPQVVKEKTDGYLAIDYGSIIPILNSSINELDSMLIDANNRISELEKENKQMKKALIDLEFRMQKLEK
jgi:hypothetical protein